MHQGNRQQATATSVDIDTATTTDMTAGPRPQVLIVDDEAVIRAPLRWLFEDAGYVVHEAPHALAAIEVLATSAAPLVVLLDLKMPTMGGDELLRLLTGKPDWAARHAFILMTAMSGPYGLADLLPVLRHLSIQVMPKPFDVEEILAAVDAEAMRLQAKAGHDADATA